MNAQSNQRFFALAQQLDPRDQRHIELSKAGIGAIFRFLS
jgi:hypothetical protein